MTNADRTAFIGRLSRAEAAAAARGLRITGYTVDGDHLTLTHAPARSKREAKVAALPPPVRRTVRRGALQGSLL